MGDDWVNHSTSYQMEPQAEEYKDEVYAQGDVGYGYAGEGEGEAGQGEGEEWIASVEKHGLDGLDQAEGEPSPKRLNYEVQLSDQSIGCPM